MSMKIVIDGKEYELNVQEAIDRNLLIPSSVKVTNFNVGDVFASEKHSQVVVIKPIWSSPISNHNRIPTYGFVGNRGNFVSYSNINLTRLFTYDEVIAYINENKLEFKGNVSNAFKNALEQMLGTQFRS